MASPLAASDARGNLDIVGAETVVEWTMPTGQTCFLSSKDTIPSGAAHIAFDLLFRPATTAASIRLRAPIMLKGLGRKMTPLFLFIPPERIESMTVVGQEETQAPEAVRKGLGSSGAVSLRFKLTQPGDLVVPPLDAVIPKKKVYWALFDSLKSLALALDLVVYLNPTTISSEEDVRSVGDALSGGKFATSIPHTDISRFYDGKGGKVLMPSELNKSIPAPGHEPEPVDSPPSYADLGPGPPAPPIKEGPQQITGPSSTSHSSRKRRRRSSSSSSNSSSSGSKSVAAVDTTQVEAICRKLVTEAMASHTRLAAAEERDAQRQQRQQEELQLLRRDLQAMETRLRDWIDERLRQHADALKADLLPLPAHQGGPSVQHEHHHHHQQQQQQQQQQQEDLQNQLDDAVTELRAEVALARDETQDTMDRIDEVTEALGRAQEDTEDLVDARVEERVEERVDGWRAELEAFVGEQVAEAEERVIDRLRASVFIDFNIYDS